MNAILNTSPEIMSFGELHFWDGLWNEKDAYRELNDNDRVNLIDKLLSTAVKSNLDNVHYSTSLVEEIAERCEQSQLRLSHQIYQQFCQTCAEKAGKKLPCDPTPSYVYRMQWIRQLIPDAKFIYMLRDPRDCMLSQKRKSQKVRKHQNRYTEALRLFFNYHPVIMSKLWRSSICTFERQKGDNCLLIQYESFCQESETQLERVSSLLDITSNYQLPEIKTGNFYKWPSDLSKTDVTICDKINSDLLRKYNYQPNSENCEHTRIAVSYLLLLFKSIFILLLNFKRYKKSLLKSIKERFAR